jgi:hypothetical protein
LFGKAGFATSDEMKQWPPMTDVGDLPVGIHIATLSEVIHRFGQGNPARVLIGHRLKRVYELVQQTGCVARFIVFGSFITATGLSY